VEKEVGGFCLYNDGGPAAGDTTFLPCAPSGVVALLESSSMSIEAK
jgi:methylenetetrahydrofolate dehydrogenase (NADP+)/methenyltetrahydrofolate cyclohydrolase